MTSLKQQSGINLLLLQNSSHKVASLHSLSPIVVAQKVVCVGVGGGAGGQGDGSRKI